MTDAPVTVDTSALVPLEKALAKLGAGLADESNPRLQAAARAAAGDLVRELRVSAAGAATPQARIVAEAITIGQGEITIGGARGVGSRGTAAGAILWGSERGGVNFAAPRGGSYWIAPAVERYTASGAERAYLAAVNGLTHDAGL